MTTTELDGVYLVIRCNLVQERFDCEVALYTSGSPEIDRSEKLFDEMAQHPRVGKFIRRRIGTSRQALPIRVPTGEAPGQRVAGLASRMALRPLLKVECGDTALRIDAGAN